MAKAYATTRMPTHQARAVQMLVLVLAGWCASRSRIVLTMDVTGWLSAKARTGPGMVAVGTNAELMNGRKMSGEENALAPAADFAVSPGMTGSHFSARVNRVRVPASGSHTHNT